MRPACDPDDGRGLLAAHAMDDPTPASLAERAGWTSFEGRLPYLAVGFLAGYSSQVFMLKLKEIADATFSTRERENGNGHGQGNGHARESHPRKAA